MFEQNAWLGQVRLRSSLGAAPPYFGQWGLKVGGKNGQVGPYDKAEDAFAAAVKAVRDAGAKKLPDDGFAKVVDAQGNPAGPAT